MLYFRLLLGILLNTSLVTSVIATQKQQQPTPATATVAMASPVGFGISSQNTASSGVEHSVLVRQSRFVIQPTASDFHSWHLPFKLRHSSLSTFHSSGPAAFFVNRVVSVTATSDSTVNLVYELAANYPTAGCAGNNGGYFMLYRHCDPGTTSLGYRIDGRPIPDLSAGQHTLPLDLGCVAGKYSIVFVPEDPNCFTVFHKVFSFYNGVVAFFPSNPLVLADSHAPVGITCGPGMTCNACGCNSSLGPDSPGDSATGQPKEQMPGGTVQQESNGTGCGSCNSGSAGTGEMPFIPLSFWMNNHMSAYPTSLGAGVHTPFDYSVHAFTNYSDNVLRIRMTDAGSARIVNFIPISTGSTTFNDGLDLYRHAKLIGGGTLQAATHIEVTRHNGEILRFQLYETADDTDKIIDRDGRLESWKDTANFGYDFTYSDTVSRKINTMTDPFGRIYTFSYGANQGGRPAVSSVAMPSPLWNNQTDMYRTDYEYYANAPNIGRIKKITEGADIPGGTRPQTNFNWNAQGQLQSTTDPVGRVTSFAYDAIGRTIMVTYHDGSNEQTRYNSGVLADQVAATRDRNGVVTTHSYDLRSRWIERIVAAAIDANILDGLPHDTIITDPNQRSISTRVYFTNTDLLKSETTDGRTTEFIRDGLNWAREVRRRPNSTTLVTNKSGFNFYRTRYSEDWMGRRTYNAYNGQRPDRRF